MKGKWGQQYYGGNIYRNGSDGLSVCTEHIDRKHAFCNRHFSCPEPAQYAYNKSMPADGIRPQISLDGYRNLLDRERAWHTGRRAYRILHEIRDRHQQFCKNDSGDKTE